MTYVHIPTAFLYNRRPTRVGGGSIEKRKRHKTSNTEKSKKFYRAIYHPTKSERRYRTAKEALPPPPPSLVPPPSSSSPQQIDGDFSPALIERYFCLISHHLLSILWCRNDILARTTISLTIYACVGRCVCI